MKRILVLALLLLGPLAYAQPGRLTPQGGTVTGVTAGTGLVGGGTGGNVTLNVACGTGIICNADNITIDTSVVTTGVLGANVVPKSNGSSWVPSSLTDDATTLASADSVAWFNTAAGNTTAGEFRLGQNTGLTTNARNGFRVQVFGDGNNYIDSKTFNGGSTFFRVGAGTETGANKTWLTVTNNTGFASFLSTVSAAGLQINNSTSNAVAPEADWIGFNGRWLIGIDVANATTSRDFVLAGLRDTFSCEDAVINGTTTITSAAQCGFTTALIGRTITGTNIPGGTTITAVASATSATLSAAATGSGTIRATITGSGTNDIIYLKHRGGLPPTVGIGVTPPSGSYRLQVSPADTEIAMGGVGIRVGPSQTGKAFNVYDSGATDRLWVTSDFYLSGTHAGTGGAIGIQADVTNQRPLAFTKNDKTTTYGFQYNGNNMQFRYITGGVLGWEVNTSGNFSTPNNTTLGDATTDTLTVNGNTTINGSSTGVGLLVVQGAGGSDRAIDIKRGLNSATLRIAGGSNDLLQIGSASGITQLQLGPSATSAPEFTLTTTAAAHATSTYGTADDTYFGWDGQSGARIGFTKKVGSVGKLTYGSGNSFTIAQSGGVNISASNAFTDRFVIDSTGNIGLGNGAAASAIAAVDLYTTNAGQTTAALTDAGSRSGTLTIQDGGSATNTGGALCFGNSSSHTANVLGWACIKGLVQSGAGNTIGDLAFSTRNATGDTALTERMRINAAGQVGINRSPGSSFIKIDVAGANRTTVASSGDGFIVGTSTRQWGTYPVGSDLRFWEYAGTVEAPGSGCDRLILKAGGNVGVGCTKTNPGFLLDIGGTLNADGATTLNAGLTVTGGIAVSGGILSTGNNNFSHDGNYTLGNADADVGNLWGHVYYNGTVPVLSGCTGTCSIAAYSTDHRGTISCTDGPSTCTVTFANAYSTNPPSCVLSGTPSAFVVRFTAATSTTAFSFGVTSGVNTYYFHCDGML